MRRALCVLAIAALAVPAFAQTKDVPLKATLRVLAADGVRNDLVDQAGLPVPYVSTARVSGSSNYVGLLYNGSLKIVILRPDVLKRSVVFDFSSYRALPWTVGDADRPVPCRPVGLVAQEQFGCTGPAFLPGPAPLATFSQFSSEQEWEYKDGEWRGRTQTDRKGNVTKVLFNFVTQPIGTTRFARVIVDFEFEDPESAGYRYVLYFSRDWESVLPTGFPPPGIVAITHPDASTWIVRPIDPAVDGVPVPYSLEWNQAELVKTVLGEPDNCTPGAGGSCHLGDYVMPFELTLKKAK